MTNLNNLVAGTDLEAEPKTPSSPWPVTPARWCSTTLQVWNHSFYWQCIKPNGGGTPSGALLDKINADFGSFEKFVEAFKAAGATQFGSGWAWLVLDNGTLKVTKTGIAICPWPTAKRPYDHGRVGARLLPGLPDRRPDYISTYLDKLVNWDFVAANLAAA